MEKEWQKILKLIFDIFRLLVYNIYVKTEMPINTIYFVLYIYRERPLEIVVFSMVEFDKPGIVLYNITIKSYIYFMDKIKNNKRHVYLSESIVNQLVGFFTDHYKVKYYSDANEFNDLLSNDWGALARSEKIPTLYVYKWGDRVNMHIYCTIWCVERAVKTNFTQDNNPGRQVQVMIDTTQPDKNDVAYMDVSGYNCYRKMQSIVKKHYTDEEIKEIVATHKPKEVLTEWHYAYADTIEPNAVYHFHDVYYADINNAHGSALDELYPKCHEEIIEMYKHRKDTVNGVPGYYKKVFNYTVGYFKKMTNYGIGTNDTRNWVVARTRTMLENYVETYTTDDDMLLYANTDGAMFTCSTPYKPQNDDTLGGFKVKRGDLYVVRVVRAGYTPYTYLTFIPYGEAAENKSKISTSLRDKIDLTKGRVVLFRQNVVDGVRQNTNITTEDLPIYEKN